MNTLNKYINILSQLMNSWRKQQYSVPLDQYFKHINIVSHPINRSCNTQQDWRSPVYSGRFEYIFAEIYSTRPIPAYMFLLSPTLGLPNRFIDALFGVHITGISSWNLWCVTHHNTRVWLRSLHWISCCSQSCLHVPLGKALLKSRSTRAQRV